MVIVHWQCSVKRAVGHGMNDNHLCQVLDKSEKSSLQLWEEFDKIKVNQD